MKTGDLETLKNLGRRFADAELRRQHSQTAGEGFNIFTTLLKEDDEVRLHTRFLHCLLNPSGPHGRGTKFLEEFFKVLRACGAKNDDGSCVKLDDLPRGDVAWTASKEKPCAPYGTIDLLLAAGNEGLAIENKINAAEQDRQLQCYADYLEEHFGKRWLFYLTKDGKKSQTHGGRSYLRISYQEHIQKWIAACCEMEDKPGLRAILEQYQQLVKNMIGNTSEAQTMAEVSGEILKTPNLIRHRQEIKDALDHARRDVINRLIQDITERLKDDYIPTFRPALPAFGSHSEGTVLLEPRRDSTLVRAAPAKLALQHWAGGESLLAGLELPSPSEEEQTRLAEIAKRWRGALQQTHKSNRTWPIGWYDVAEKFNDAKIAELLDSGAEEFVTVVVEKFRNCVKAIEAACEALPQPEGAAASEPQI